MGDRLTIVVGLTALLLAACGGPSAQPATSVQPQASESTTPTETTAAAAPATTQAAPVTTAGPAPAMGEGCQPDSPTALSSDWTIFFPTGTAYGFGYPSAWGNLTGELRFPAGGLLDAETFAETGLSDDAEVLLVLVRSDTTTIGVHEWSGVTSPIEEIHRRMIARSEELPEVREILRTDLAACVAGEPSLGAELLTEAPPNVEADSIYAQDYYVVHEGILYDLQLTEVSGEDTESVAIFEEFLRTWRWTEDEAETVGEAVTFEAHTASSADFALPAPDPATFTSTFAPFDTIYVVYQGVVGEIRVTFRRGAEVLGEGSNTVPEGNWGANWLSPPSEGFPPGSYEVVLEALETGVTVTLSFTVEGS
ncbi:MAG: hypothetical protein ACRDXD_08280 [Acidimicrobiia bacterium]